MKHFISIVLLSLSLLTASVAMLAQEKECVDETKAEVPALREFHTVIFKLWHTAWPEKDYQMMGALLPEIERGAAQVAAAKLPGILREKQTTWAENITKLQEIVGEYKNGVEEGDNQKLLDAGERLHSQYERLVRVIRPALKEIDQFHAVLYMLYHYYMPQNNTDSVRTSVVAMKEKMEILNKAQLPERLREKGPAFTEARMKLSESVDELARCVSMNDQDNIKAAIHTVHSRYETLQRVFE